jgi:hypothetical protein
MTKLPCAVCEGRIGARKLLCELSAGSRPNENVGKRVSKLLRSDGKDKEGRGGKARFSRAGVAD